MAGLNVIIVTDEAGSNQSNTSIPEPLESIHPGISSLLNKIGLSGAEFAASRALYSGVYSAGNYSPLGEDSSGIWKGMHINRHVFNDQLVQQTRNQGVGFMFNEKVEDFILEKAGSMQQQTGNKIIGIKTSSTELFAKYIIDASGKKGIAGKKLNFKRRFFSPPLACWTGVSEYDETFPFDPNASHFIPGKNGWTWLAPQPPSYCTWTRLSVVNEKSLLPPDELKDYPIVGKIHFANMRWRLFRPVCSEGIILCGDAAGILDPAAGQGIFNALLSGITAANTIIKCIQEPGLASFHLALYDDWFAGQFEAKVKRLKQYYKDHVINI